jgi:hypothetical protein
VSGLYVGTAGLLPCCTRLALDHTYTLTEEWPAPGSSTRTAPSASRPQRTTPTPARLMCWQHGWQCGARTQDDCGSMSASVHKSIVYPCAGACHNH